MKKDPNADIEPTQLLEEVQRLLAELRTGEAIPEPRLDSRLDEELGLDSLSRVELLVRLERRFGRDLPESLASEAECPGDLLAALSAQQPWQPPAAGQAPQRQRISADGLPEPPQRAATLVDVLRYHASRHGERVHVHLYDAHGGYQSLSYADLYRDARCYAAGLLELGMAQGEPVAIMLPTGRAYLGLFWGVLLAGGVPLPIYPPLRPSQIEEHLRRHRAILENAAATILATTAEAMAAARLLKLAVPSLRRVAEPAELCRDCQPRLQPPIRPGDLALLQYTSGSTGSPKGVMLSHNDLLANIRAMGKATGANASDVFVSWLPLYHDMGLIGAWLGSLYFGTTLVLMSPLTFLARPERWLQAISRHRGTLAGAPNFAYDLCLRRIDEATLSELDLSSWRFAFNGAEPVSAATMQRFGERFSYAGFSPKALAPVYGLAEAAVGLTFPPLDRGLKIDRIDRQRFTTEGVAHPWQAGPPDQPQSQRAGEGGQSGGQPRRQHPPPRLVATNRPASQSPQGADERGQPAQQPEVKDRPADPRCMEVPACGRPLPGYQIRVVDDQGQELGERRQGKVLFRGPSASAGYYRNPQATAAMMREDGWHDSGDLGYLADGELYLTGRRKDMIIRAGRNIHPAEIEEAVGGIEGIRKGCVAVFGATAADGEGGEQLIVAAESRRAATRGEQLSEAIRGLVSERCGVSPDKILLLPLGAVLKTSSGKIRRSACRDLYLRGELGSQHPAPWLQLLRVSLSAIAGLPPRAIAWLRQWGFASWGWLWFLLLALPTWLGVFLSAKPERRWALMGKAGRGLARLTATPLEVQGSENIPPGPCILVANHRSYLDGIALVTLLPGRWRFVAKRELADQRIAGAFLRRIDSLFVERFERRQSGEDASALNRAAQQLPPLIVFPEGTFVRGGGLLPLRLGAFVAATEAQIPVIPIAISGTDQILPAESWRPAHAAIKIRIAEPLHPQASDWRAAVALRDAARAAMEEMLSELDGR
jgi:1-acyl-sn-glycerol-3-phosphate acyltransferase